MKLGDLIVRLGMNTRDFDKKIGAAMGRFRSFGRNMKRVGKNLTASVTAPLGIIGVTSVKTAADFEQAMAKVKAVSGATGGAFKALEKQAKDLGSSTVFTAQQVAGLQENYAKLGFSSEEIGKVTEATLMLAQASGSDLAQAAEVAGGTLRAFGLDADETAHLTDVMAKSFSTSALDLERFQESMKYVAPVAKSAGISVEQTTAMLGLLANAGLHGSQAGTALRRIISELGATGGDVAGTIEKLAGEGLNLADAKDEVGRSAQSALLILAEGIGTLDDYTAELEGADGAAAGMAATMNDTTTGSLLRMQSAIEGAQIAIGTALAPVVEELAGMIEDLAGWFTGLDESTQHAIIAIAGVAAAIGPLLVVGPQMASAIIGITKAVKAMNLAWLASPWTAVAIGVGIVAAALYKVATATNAAEYAQNSMQNAMKNAREAAMKEAVKVDVLVKQYQMAEDSLEGRKKILDQLKAIAPDHFANLDAEKSSFEDLTTAVDAYNEAMLKKAMQAAMEAELQKMAEKKVDLLSEQNEHLEEASRLEAEIAEINRKKEAGEMSGIRAAAQIGKRNTALNIQQQKMAILQKQIDRQNEAMGIFVDRMAEMNVAADENAAATNNQTTATEDQTAATEAGTAAEEADEKAVMATVASLREKAKATADVIAKMQELAGQGVAIDFTELDKLQNDLGNTLGMLEQLGAKMVDAPEKVDTIAPTTISTGVAGPTGLVGADEMQARADAAQQLSDSITSLGPVATEVMAALDSSVASVTSNMQGYFDTAFQSVVDGTKTMKQAMAEAAKSIIAALLAETVATAIANAFKTAKNSGPAAAFLGPTLAAAGAAGVKALFNSIPAFASGGIVSGPTLAQVGEYRNASSNPEVIAPLNKLRDMIGGGQTVQVVGTISGNDILISSERAAIDRGRLRGF
jgi:hypothetical protein